MIPVIRDNVIVITAKRAHHRHLTKLLAEAGVRRAGDEPVTEELQQEPLGQSDTVGELVNDRVVESNGRSGFSARGRTIGIQHQLSHQEPEASQATQMPPRPGGSSAARVHFEMRVLLQRTQRDERGLAIHPEALLGPAVRSERPYRANQLTELLARRTRT